MSIEAESEELIEPVEPATEPAPTISQPTEEISPAKPTEIVEPTIEPEPTTFHLLE